MKVFGWTVAGHRPDTDKIVIIAAPHTSNWDVFFLLAAAFCFRVRINFLIKDAWFFPVMGSVLRFFGGIPVDRSRSNNLVDDLATRIKDAPYFALVVPPAGTRKYTEYWKSGFYHIAAAAQIPLVSGYLDYAKKEAGLGLSFVPTGDVSADMDRLREFYGPITGRYPEKKSRIRLRQEDEDASSRAAS